VAPIAQARSIEVSRSAEDACGRDHLLRFFLDLWTEKRGARRMPSRSDFRPADMRMHIGSIVVVEALAGFSDFRFKLIGTEVAKYFLADCTGKTIREAYLPPDDKFGECVLTNYRDAASGRTPLHTRLDGIRWSNDFVYDMRALYLPLSEDGTTATGVLTAFSYAFGKRPAGEEALKLRSV
jgi:hypothetical protein